MFCPFYKNKEVFDGFNEIVEAFNGKPLTEEEFRSADLRLQRSGSDFSAMEIAYTVYDLNGGNTLDLAPNGEKSNLFESLLDYYDGNRTRAIRAKAEMFSKKFREKNGDWLSEQYKGNLDTNGEPILTVSTKSSTQTDKILNIDFKPFSATEGFGESLYNRLLDGETISSKEILQTLIDHGLYRNSNIELVSVLLNHDVPVRLGYLSEESPARTTSYEGGTGIILNSRFINKISNRYLATIVLHEMMHAMTANAISNPKTKEEKEFVKLNRQMYKLLNKLLPASSYPREDEINGYYALVDEDEFAANFLTDRTVRQLVLDSVKESDQKNSTGLFAKLKEYINSITKFFVNKKVFKTNEERLKAYEKAFKNYIYNKPLITRGNISSKSGLMKMYDQISDRALFYDKYLEDMKSFEKSFSIYKNNNYMRTNRKKLDENKGETVSYDGIINKLQARLLAVQHSALSKEDRLKQAQATQSQIQLLNSETASKYIAVTSMLKYIGPKLIQDIESIIEARNSGEILSDKELQYQKHDNLGVYYHVLNDMHSIIYTKEGVAQMLDEANRMVTKEEDKISADDIGRLIKDISELRDFAQTGLNIIENLILKSAARTIYNIGDSVESPTSDEYAINILKNVAFEQDITKLEALFSPADSVKNETIRLLAHMVGKVNRKADDKTAEKFVELFSLYKKIGMSNSVLDFYETDERGRTTGYLIRKRNYGVFYKDYDEFLIQLNRDINKKYKKQLEDNGLIIPDDNRVAPDLPEARLEWSRRRNKWLAQRTERQYTSEYYEAWEELSAFAKEALQTLNNEIFAIEHRPDLIGVDGHIMLERLSDEEYRQYLDLKSQKDRLSSRYDEYGNEKTGVQLEIANELYILNSRLYAKDAIEKSGGLEEFKNWVYKRPSSFNIQKFEELRKKDIDIKRNTDAWKAERDALIKECGGQEEYEKWVSNEEDHNFDYKKFKKWEERNTRWVFKKNEDGEAIVFKLIEQAVQGQLPDYGEEYAELKAKKNELLRPHIKPNGEINEKQITEALKGKLEKIDKKLKAIKNKHKNPSVGNKYSKAFDKYLKFVDTDAFSQIKRELFDEYQDFEMVNLMLGAYGTTYLDPISGIESFTPYSIYQKLEARNKLKYMEAVPANNWIEKTQNNKYLNPNFDPNENTAYIPKLKFVDENGKINTRYDNSKKFAKFEEGNSKFDKNMRNLYDAVFNTMKESNAMQTNRTYADNFLLPQIPGTFWKRLKNQPFMRKIKALFQYIGETWGFAEAADDAAVYGQEYDEEGTDALDLREKRVRNIHTGFINALKGKRPDGSRLNIVPQYYTRKMKDPTQLSSDLLEILCSYYNMSYKYQEKSKIKDTCETLLDMLRNQKFLERSQFATIATGGTYDISNTYEMARTFLERNLYDVKMRRANIKILGTNRMFEISKFSSTFARWTTARNLGLNPKVALVGALTSSWAHIIQSLVGRRYSFADAYNAGNVVLWHIFKNVGGIRYLGNRASKDKLMVLAERLNVADQLSKKIKGSNRYKIADIVSKNSLYGMMSKLDFFVKSNVMVSVLMSYRYVDGKFITKDEIRMNQHIAGQQGHKKWRKEQFKKFKKAPTLYSLLNVKGQNITIDDKYKAALNESKWDEIKSRVQKYAEAADGMATQEQKAAITSNFLGALLLIHRQYLPLMIQERAGATVYDYDTHQYKNGQFRTVAKFAANFAASGMLGGAITGATIGSFIPFIGTILGAGIGGIYGLVKRIGGHKGTKAVLHEMFNDYSNEKAAHATQNNRYNMKQVALEVLLFKYIVSQIVAFMCRLADDKPDWQLLQWIAYCLRGAQWEINNAYEPLDILNNIKSPSASLGTMDSIEEFSNDIGFFDIPILGTLSGMLFPQQNTTQTLYDLSQSSEGIVGGLINKRGLERIKRKGNPYDGKMKIERDFIKLTPFKNIIEQAKGSKQKRTYHENQIMRIDKKQEQMEFNPLISLYEYYNPVEQNNYYPAY